MLLLIQSVAGLLRVDRSGFRPTLIFAFLSALVSCFPIGELPFARVLISLNINCCIPLTALTSSRIWYNATGVRLLDKSAVSSLWVFALVAGLVLYPMALGLGRFDPYELGWNFSLLFLITLAITIVLLFKRNRSGIVLILCILGYNLQVLESTNLWDYLIDPTFVLLSAACLLSRLYLSLFQHIHQSNDDIK